MPGYFNFVPLISRPLTYRRKRRFNVITDKQVAMDEPVVFEITTNETRTAAAATAAIYRSRRKSLENAGVRLYKSLYIGLPSRSINHLPVSCSVALVKMPTCVYFPAFSRNTRLHALRRRCAIRCVSILLYTYSTREKSASCDKLMIMSHLAATKNGAK